MDINIGSFKDHLDYFREVISSYLHDDLGVEVLDNLMTVSLDKKNPERLKLFARGAHQLLRLVWEAMAPHEKIEQCDWHKEWNRTNLSESTRVYLFGGLAEGFVNHLQPQLSTPFNEWVESYEVLVSLINSQIQLKDHHLSTKKADVYILEVVHKFLVFLKNSKILRKMYRKLLCTIIPKKQIRLTLIDYFIKGDEESLYELSVDMIEITKIGPQSIYLKVDGKMQSQYLASYNFVAQLQVSCVDLIIIQNKIKILEKSEDEWLQNER